MSNTRYRVEYQIPIFSKGPELEYITYSKDEGDWNNQLHAHPFMEMALVIGGKGSLLVEEDSFPIEEGDLIIIPSNKLHTEKSAENSALEYYIMGIKNFSLSEEKKQDEEDDEEGEKDSPVFVLNNFKGPVENTFKEMIYEAKVKKPGFEIMLQGLLLKVFALIIRATDYKASFNQTKEIRSGCAKIKEYIDAHYSDKITLDFLADLSCISKYHLVHEFSKYMGVPPIAYQLKRRIQEAKNLLETTDSSISEISYALGFSSTGHFSQRFSAEEGCSPLNYRKKVRSRL